MPLQPSDWQKGKLTIVSDGEAVWQCKLSSGRKLAHMFWNKGWQLLLKREIHIPYDPEIPLLGIYHAETGACVHRTQTWECAEARCLYYHKMAKTKMSKNWINYSISIVWNIHNHEKEQSIDTTAWMNLIEKIEGKKPDKFHIVSFYLPKVKNRLNCSLRDA